jgi:hypothetical protein
MRTRHALSVALLGAVLSASPFARAAGADPTTATAQQKQRAQAHFTKAHALFARGGFNQALGEATASWDIVASPNARIMMARCLREVGKLARAYAEYSGTIDDAGSLARKEARYAETAKAATNERNALEAQVALITVRVAHPTEATQLTVGGQPVDPSAWSRPLPEDPGNLDVVLQVGGKDVARQSFMLAAGDKKTIDLDASPPPAPVLEASVVGAEPAARSGADLGPTMPNGREGFRTPAYVLGGVGVAGFVVFAIFGALDDSTFHGLQSACPGNACPPGKASDISTGKTEQTVANAGLAFGVAGIAAGGTLFAFSLGSRSEAQPTAGSASLAVRTESHGRTELSGCRLVVTPGFVGLRGSL